MLKIYKCTRLIIYLHIESRIEYIIMCPIQYIVLFSHLFFLIQIHFIRYLKKRHRNGGGLSFFYILPQVAVQTLIIGLLSHCGWQTVRKFARELFVLLPLLSKLSYLLTDSISHRIFRAKYAYILWRRRHIEYKMIVGFSEI